MHDNLLYDAVGLHRLYNRISQLFHTTISDIIFTAAPNLNELFSHAIHIGNASHITRTSRQSVIVDRVLILSSVDERFDFKLLLAVATDCDAIVFDIYGHIHRNDRIIRTKIEGLVKQRGNIKYHGLYATCDIESLVRKYDVSFAPYRNGIGLTKHIDPLRFYHCLNAGMEVLTTDIPAIKHFSNAVHIIRGPNDFRDTIGRLGTAGGARKNIGIQYTEVTCSDRGRQIIDAAKLLPKFRRLAAEVAEKSKSATTTALGFQPTVDDNLLFSSSILRAPTLLSMRRASTRTASSIMTGLSTFIGGASPATAGRLRYHSWSACSPMGCTSNHRPRMPMPS